MAIATNELLVTEGIHCRIIEIHISGKLQRADYEAFNAVFTQEPERDCKPRLLIILDDFDGWSVGAAWEDLKFDVQHFNDVDRIAIVGDSKWESMMTAIYKPFTMATVKYFDRTEEFEARAWITEQEW